MTDRVQVFGEVPSGAPDSALMCAVESVREVAARPGYAICDRDLLENLRVIQRLGAMLDSVKLGLLAELQTRPEAVPDALPGRTAYTFLTQGLRESSVQAGRDVAAAAALASASASLPRMAQALTDGEITREHVDVGVRTLARIPKKLRTKLIHPDPDPDPLPAAAAEVVEDAAGADVEVTPEPRPESPAGPGVPRTGADVIDEILVGQSQVLPPSTVDRLGKDIVHRLDPDRAERGFNAEAYERRCLTWTRDFAGMGVYKLILDPATHALIEAAIAAWSKPQPAGTATTPDGRTFTVPDPRTHGQRRADAITALILTGANANSTGTVTGTGTTDDTPTDSAAEPMPEQDAADPNLGSNPALAGLEGLPEGVFMARPCPGVHVSVIATLDQIAAAFGATDPAARTAGLARIGLAGQVGDHPGATLDPRVLARLACDSPLHRIIVDRHGVPLDHGYGKRFASPQQRRALAVRDAGCVIPGCPAPPEWCDAHHLIPWESGGPTDLENMVLLCGRHHTAHHAGQYPIRMREGIPWIQLPGWQNITQPWVRNTTHTHHHLADTAAHQLLDDPPWDGDAAA